MLTLPVYVDEGGKITIGFQSSKAGANDDDYAGDNRPGWWLATGFRLFHTPAYVVEMPSDAKWLTICLPFAAQPGDGVKIYTISGISSNKQELCLNEVMEMEAGVAYVIYTENERATFLGSDDRVSKPVDDGSALKGMFLGSSSSIPQDAFVLMGDTWKKVSSVSNFAWEKYRAYLSGTTTLTELSEEGQTTMAIECGDVLTGVDLQRLQEKILPRYNLGGQRIKQPSGLYIEGGQKRVGKK